MDYKIIEGYKHIRYNPEVLSEKEIIEKSRLHYKSMNKRRSVRTFSDKEVPKEVINNIILSAGTAPTGANKQPFTFCVIRNPDTKSAIRKAAEEEEELSYAGRMNPQWIKDLKPLGTDTNKDFLEIAPLLIVVFKQSYGMGSKGEKKQHYYVNESVGIACGFLINAIHQSGLVTLTHTPSPMSFLTKLLERPVNEKPFLLLPVGYPGDEIYVPDIARKGLSEIMVEYN